MFASVVGRFCLIVDSLSAAARMAAAVLALALVACTLLEVILRYFFQSPTIWAFDVAYMLNGSVFLLAAAAALQSGKHVRIDFLSTRLPLQAQKIVDAVFFLGPGSLAIAVMAYAALNRTLRALRTGETEAVSAWAPLMWPFYSVLTLGLCLLLLQCIAQGLRSLLAAQNPENGSP